MKRILVAISFYWLLTPIIAQYSIDSAKILFNNKCGICHHSDNLYQFRSEADIRANATTIAYVIANNIMPPWIPDNSYSKFKHNRALSENEKGLLLAWTADLQKQKKVSNEDFKKTDINKHRITQNLALKVDIKHIVLPPSQLDTTYLFEISFENKEPVTIGRIMFGCSNLSIIHHCNYFIVDESNSKSEVYVSGYTPGNSQSAFALGTGFILPRKGKIVGDLHVPPIAKTEKFDVFFSLEKALVPLLFELHLYPTNNFKPNGMESLYIKPDTVVTLEAEKLIAEDLILTHINPHMHLLGKSAEAFAIKSTGDTVPLIKINKWNFDMQDFYEFENPIYLKRGSRIVYRATYDNTSKNPRNPNNPPVVITEGWYTSQEMFTLFLINKTLVR